VRVLSRHFLASYLRLFVTSLFVSSIAIVIVELLLNFDEILGDRADASRIASYLFLRLPSYYFRDLIPVSSFAAAFLCVGLAARSREVTAAKAGGIPPQRMVVPILGAAMLLALGTAVLDETVVLAATREWSRREHRGEEVTYRQGSFWYHRDDTIYSVQEVDPDSATLLGVRVFETDPSGRLRRSLYADVVDFDEEQRWHLRDAIIRSFDPELPSAAPRVEQRDETVAAMAVAHDLALLEAGAQTLSLCELGEYIGARAQAGQASSRQREALHTRLANPWSVVAFALLAIPLGLSVERRRGLAAAAVLGISLLGVFYTARAAAAIFAAGGFAAAVYAPWLLLATLLIVGGIRFARPPG
jgi:lipopolysaccharide export system permease protein